MNWSINNKLVASFDANLLSPKYAGSVAMLSFARCRKNSVGIAEYSVVTVLHPWWARMRAGRHDKLNSRSDVAEFG